MKYIIRIFLCLIEWIFLLFLIIAFHQLRLKREHFTFTDEAVGRIAQKYYIGMDPKRAFKLLIKDFEQQYPGHILPSEDRRWIFMNWGGSKMGSVLLLHASVTEYVLIFGTGIRSSGNSGRSWVRITNTILSGTFQQWREGEIEPKTFYPGDTVYLNIGEAAAVELAPGTWMVEYGRGLVPLKLGFALLDTFFSTQDFTTLLYVLFTYFKALFLEIETAQAEIDTEQAESA